MAIEIVDFPSYKMVDLSIVKLPEGSSSLPGLVNIQKTMEHHYYYIGQYQLFLRAIFNSYVTNYRRVPEISWNGHWYLILEWSWCNKNPLLFWLELFGAHLCGNQWANGPSSARWARWAPKRIDEFILFIPSTITIFPSPNKTQYPISFHSFLWNMTHLVLWCIVF